MRGTLKCGACGSVMTTAATRANCREYRNYRCVTRGKQGSRSCTTRQLPAEAIEGFVVEQLKEAIRQGRISAAVASERRNEWEAKLTRLQTERSRLLEECPADPEAMNHLLEIDRALARVELRLQEPSWLVRTLSEFEPLWEVFTPRNRQRLVKALVEDVIVDESEGKVRVRLADLGQRMNKHAGIEV